MSVSTVDRSRREPSVARIMLRVAGSQFESTLFFSTQGVAQLVAEAEVQRQAIAEAPVVLQVAEVHVLLELGDQDVAEGIGRSQPEHEVGEVVEVVVGGDAGRPGELSGVGVAAVERVDVLHLGEDALDTRSRP